MLAKPKRDARVDAYIAGAPEFAKPILIHLRALFHQACPDVEETMKWSRPHFLRNGMLGGMSAFKHHCAFGFWMHEAVLGEKPGTLHEREGMGQFGRITSLKDLPNDKTLIALIKKAVALNESGAKRPVARRPQGERVLVVPDFIKASLKRNKAAESAFEGFSFSHKKEYVEWITEAKREETRVKRIETMLQWLAKGKSRNWKYENC